MVEYRSQLAALFARDTSLVKKNKKENKLMIFLFSCHRPVLKLCVLILQQVVQQKLEIAKYTETAVTLLLHKDKRRSSLELGDCS